MTKRILSILLTLLMLASLLPAAFADWTVPEGYSEYEYNKLAAFLETEDESGVKNGAKLNEDYDVDDPFTWGDGWVFMPYGDTPYQVMMISWGDSGLVGSIDLSGFTKLDELILSGNRIPSINISNCPDLGGVEVDRCGLQTLDCSNSESLYCLICNDNQLTSLNVSGCTGMKTGIFCDSNLLTELDLSDCAQMVTLDCGNNKLENLNVSKCAALSTLNAENNALSKLDLSGCASLQVLNLAGNHFKSIDTSACPKLHLDSVTAEGPGTVGYWETLASGGSRVILYAYPDEDALFLGWYNAEGELLSTEPEWNASSELESLGAAVTAKFKWDLADGVYLVGTVNDWAPSPADLFAANPDNAGEYMLETTLAKGDEIKVIESAGGNWTWYPSGDNYVVDEAHAGDVTIYFRNTYNSAWAEFGGYFYIAVKPAPHSVSLSTVGEGTASFAPETPAVGETVTLTVAPAEGSVYDYTEIYQITDDGKELVELGSLEWNDDELSFLMPDYDILIVVYFKSSTVTLRFDAGEGTVEPESVAVVPGEAIGELPVPTREGDWVFLGWFDAPAATQFAIGQGNQVTVDSTFDADATIYAHWRLPGDVNGDGKVNTGDITLLAKYVKARGQGVEIVPFSGNIDGDGGNKITSADVTLLAKYVKAHGSGVVIN